MGTNHIQCVTQCPKFFPHMNSDLYQKDNKKEQILTEHSKAISLEQRKVVMKTEALCLEGKMPSPRFRKRKKKSE